VTVIAVHEQRAVAGWSAMAGCVESTSTTVAGELSAFAGTFGAGPVIFYFGATVRRKDRCDPYGGS
jgi:hypothetical protein